MSEVAAVALVTCAAAALFVWRWRGGAASAGVTFVFVGGVIALGLVDSFHHPLLGGERRVDAILVDLSRRTGPDPQRLLAEEFIGMSARAHRRIVIGVAATPHVLADDDGERRELTLPPLDGADRARADLGAALSALALRLAADETAALRLVGAFADGEPLSLPRSLPATEVVRVEAPKSRRENLAVAVVGIPVAARPGERAAIEAAVFGEVGVPRQMGVAVPEVGVLRDLEFSPGDVERRVVLEFEVAMRDRIHVRLQGHEDWDADSSDDRAEAWLDVLRESPRVLRVGAAAGDWPLALNVNWPGLDRIRSPLEAIAAIDEADLVVIEDVAADDAGAADLFGILPRYVAAGGGLVLAGAARAFGAGNWADTTIDDLSPLHARPPRDRRQVTAVLDRSGSMAGGRFERAARATLAVHDDLEGGDRLDVLLFAGDVEAVAFAGDDAHDDVERVLGGVRAGGGTRLGPALDRAFGGARVAGATSVVLILTDGDDPETLTPDAFARWRESARAGGHVVHVFLFGERRDEAAAENLAELARASGGQLVVVDDFGALTEPFLAAARRDLVVGDARIVREDGASAQVGRLLRTRRDQGARVLAAHDDVVAAAAVVRRGGGSVLALPLSPSARDFAAALGPPTAVRAVLLSVAARPATQGRLQVDVEGGGYVVAAEGLDASTAIDLVGDGIELRLEPTDPGRHASEIVARPPRAGPVSLFDSAGRSLGRLHLPAPPRAAPVPLDLDRLRRRLDAAAARGEPPRALLLAALVVLLIDVSLRVFIRSPLKFMHPSAR